MMKNERKTETKGERYMKTHIQTQIHIILLSTESEYTAETKIIT